LRVGLGCIYIALLGVYLGLRSKKKKTAEKQNGGEAEKQKSRKAKKQGNGKKAKKKKQRRSRETEMQKACPKRKRKSRKNSRPFNMKEREGFNRYDVYYFLK
jgi:Flp pilus assembly protein TadB